MVLIGDEKLSTVKTVFGYLFALSQVLVNYMFSSHKVVV